MAKDAPEDKTPPQSTNALLAAILQTDQAILAAIGDTNDTLAQLLNTEQASLKVQTDSRDYLKTLSDAIAGGERYKVIVTQIADAVAAKLKK